MLKQLGIIRFPWYPFALCCTRSRPKDLVPALPPLQMPRVCSLPPAMFARITLLLLGALARPAALASCTIACMAWRRRRVDTCNDARPRPPSLGPARAPRINEPVKTAKVSECSTSRSRIACLISQLWPVGFRLPGNRKQAEFRFHVRPLLSVRCFTCTAQQRLRLCRAQLLQSAA